VSKFQVSDAPEMEVAGQLERAIEKRWHQLSARRYTSPYRAVADLTRDGEEILRAAGLEGVPPFPGCLKLGSGNGSSNSELRLYTCTALVRDKGDQKLVFNLEVRLTQGNGDQELGMMLSSCPELRVVSPAQVG